jgi:hypothetical protein
VGLVRQNMEDIQMKAFAGIPAFLGDLAVVSAELDAVRRRALEKAAVIIETDAKESLGTYQEGWPELAESTQEARARAGYSADEPLLRSKTLQGAITHEHDGSRRVLVGVPDNARAEEPDGARVSDVAVWMEEGTSEAPPRPFMGPAAFRKGPEIAEQIGVEVVIHLKGK